MDRRRKGKSDQGEQSEVRTTAEWAADANDTGVGIVDAVIAATALEYDEPVVTRDEKDFVRRLQNDLGLDALRVELYTS